MSDDLIRITVSDGKYTFAQRKDGSCHALRYGVPWKEDIFDGLTLSMAYRIEELEAKLAKALRALERIELSTDTREQGAIAMATLAEMKGQDDDPA